MVESHSIHGTGIFTYMYIYHTKFTQMLGTTFYWCRFFRWRLKGTNPTANYTFLGGRWIYRCFWYLYHPWDERYIYLYMNGWFLNELVNIPFVSWEFLGWARVQLEIGDALLGIHIMVNCCFGLVVWIPRIPLWKGLLLRATPRIPNHQPKPTINHKLKDSVNKQLNQRPWTGDRGSCWIWSQPLWF